MKTLLASQLKEGMELSDNGGMVEEVSDNGNGTFDITFSTYDYECGEVDYHPCTVKESEQYKVDC